MHHNMYMYSCSIPFSKTSLFKPVLSFMVSKFIYDMFMKFKLWNVLMANETIHYILWIKDNMWILLSNILAYHASVMKRNVNTVTLLSEKERARLANTFSSALLAKKSPRKFSGKLSKKNHTILFFFWKSCLTKCLWKDYLWRV